MIEPYWKTDRLTLYVGGSHTSPSSAPAACKSSETDEVAEGAAGGPE